MSVFAQLKQFERPGHPPSSARVDPRSSQRPSPTINIRHAWMLIKFIVLKGKIDLVRFSLFSCSVSIVLVVTEVFWELCCHHLMGPRKKSWGIEMTLITSLIRNAGLHSYLADVVSLTDRTILELRLIPCSGIYVL
jgi:hypothetical protein